MAAILSLSRKLLRSGSDNSSAEESLKGKSIKDLELTVRHFVESDQPQVKKLILAGLKERWGILDDNANPDIDDIAASYGAENFIVVFRDDQLGGTGGLAAETGSVVRVVRMWIAKDLRRAGIGTMILARLLELSSQRGCSKVLLETTATWTDAIAFYQKHGFKIDGYRDGDVHFFKELVSDL